jgi:hypothetical protein
MYVVDFMITFDYNLLHPFILFQKNLKNFFFHVAFVFVFMFMDINIIVISWLG